jgi:hypothetical protein
VQSDSFNHLADVDDLDDDTPTSRSAAKYDRAEREFNSLLQIMLQVWLGFLGLAILLWFRLRWAVADLMARWRALMSSLPEAEAADAWASTRRSAWRARYQLLDVQKAAFLEIAQPLEPYVIVFILFGIPVSALYLHPLFRRLSFWKSPLTHPHSYLLTLTRSLVFGPSPPSIFHNYLPFPTHSLGRRNGNRLLSDQLWGYLGGPRDGVQ